MKIVQNPVGPTADLADHVGVGPKKFAALWILASTSGPVPTP